MTLNRSEFLERKFQKKPGFSRLYQDQIEEYMDSGYARQLSKEEAKSNVETTNCKPHHGVLNINKLGNMRVVFYASAKFHNTSLNDNLLPGVEFLNDLVSILLEFREERFEVIADINKMFDQVRMRLKFTDALRFLANPQDNINDYVTMQYSVAPLMI